MPLDINGWIDGITASGVVIFGILFGVFFIYRSRKTKAKLLLYLGLANMFAGLTFLGVFLDFLLVLFFRSKRWIFDLCIRYRLDREYHR